MQRLARIIIIVPLLGMGTGCKRAGLAADSEEPAEAEVKLEPEECRTLQKVIDISRSVDPPPTQEVEIELMTRAMLHAAFCTETALTERTDLELFLRKYRGWVDDWHKQGVHASPRLAGSNDELAFSQPKASTTAEASEAARRAEAELADARRFYELEPRVWLAIGYLWVRQELLRIHRLEHGPEDAKLDASIGYDSYPFTQSDAAAGLLLLDHTQRLPPLARQLIEDPELEFVNAFVHEADVLRSGRLSAETISADKRASQVINSFYQLALSRPWTPDESRRVLGDPLHDWSGAMHEFSPTPVDWPTPALRSVIPVTLGTNKPFKPVNLTTVRLEIASFDNGNVGTLFRVRDVENEWSSFIDSNGWYEGTTRTPAVYEPGMFDELRKRLIRELSTIESIATLQSEISIWILNFGPEGPGHGFEGNNDPSAASEGDDATRTAAKVKAGFAAVSIDATDTTLCVLNHTVLGEPALSECARDTPREDCIRPRPVKYAPRGVDLNSTRVVSAYDVAIDTRLQGLDEGHTCDAEMLLNVEFLQQVPLHSDALLGLAILLRKRIDHGDLDHLAAVLDAILDHAEADYNALCRQINYGASSSCSVAHLQQVTRAAKGWPEGYELFKRWRKTARTYATMMNQLLDRPAGSAGSVAEILSAHSQKNTLEDYQKLATFFHAHARVFNTLPIDATEPTAAGSEGAGDE